MSPVVLFIVRRAVDALVLCFSGCTVLQSVSSCAQRACFLPLAFPEGVIESAAAVAPLCYDVVLYSTDCPS